MIDTSKIPVNWDMELKFKLKHAYAGFCFQGVPRIGASMTIAGLHNAFHYLCEEAGQAYYETPDAAYQEPYYVKVLQFVMDHLEEKDFFLRSFLDMVEHPREEFIPLIQFCMQTLQWNEIAEAARLVAQQAQRSLTVKWMELILRSFTMAWPGLDYYDYYLAKRPK